MTESFYYFAYIRVVVQIVFPMAKYKVVFVSDRCEDVVLIDRLLFHLTNFNFVLN